MHAVKTEHAGAKNMSASSGYWGLRVDAKERSRSLRRRNGAREIEAQCAERALEPPMGRNVDP
jgi:hypothetical protein